MAKFIELPKKKFKVAYSAPKESSSMIVEAATWLRALQEAEKELLKKYSKSEIAIGNVELMEDKDV